MEREQGFKPFTGVMSEDVKKGFTNILRSLKELRMTPYDVVLPSAASPSERARFAMFVRDPRIGMGEREVGRTLMYVANVMPKAVLQCGRADDLFYLGYAYHIEHQKPKGKKRVANPYWDYLSYLIVKSPDQEVRKYVLKWMPRERNNNLLHAVRTFRRRYGWDSKTYRKLISQSNTMEYYLSSHTLPEDYHAMPRLALRKYKKALLRKDAERFNQFRTERRNIKPPYVRYRKMIQREDFNVEISMKEYFINFKNTFINKTSRSPYGGIN